MARESQGLQIALIIFFMLTIVLAVTTFLYHGKYIEAQKQAQDNEQMASDKGRLLAAEKAENAELKGMVAPSLSDKSLGEVKEQFKKDMDTYAKNYPDDSQFWSPVLSKMWDALVDRNKENVALKTNNQDLQARFAVREVTKDDLIKKLEANTKEAGDKVVQLGSEYDKQRAELAAGQAALTQTMESIRKAAAEKVNRSETEVKTAKDQVERLRSEEAGLATQVKQFNRPAMDHPLGEVTWVDQRSATVWINLGRADALDRQTTFSVYSADADEMGKAKKKATVEVTKILGDHSSEARITEDKNSDPITLGDKIFTPLWSPGQHQHFALAGIMNIDGDGRNAVGTVRNLITANGGQIDCMMDESGNKVGEVTTGTRCVVRGDDPKDGKQTETMSKILRDAERFGARLMTLAELKQQMGYKPGTVGGRAPRPAASAAPGPAAKPAAKAVPAKKVRPKAEPKTEEDQP
ncbi:MAG: hypothetical protein ABSG86_02080 [Thermoguttaceae bacterium]|jgi:hypothetical protein